MASLLHPTTTPNTTTLKQPRNNCFCPLKPTIPYNVSFLTNTNRFKTNSTKCYAFFDNVDHFPALLRSGLLQFEDLPDMQRCEVLVFGALIWLYLTARPGVLIGAIDAYLLAPLQLAFDNLSGRRNLKTTDFLVGDKLGEGSFGVVYSGLLDPKSKDNKVILKKVPFLFP